MATPMAAIEMMTELQARIGPAYAKGSNGVGGKPITSTGLLDFVLSNGFASRGRLLAVAVRMYLPGGTPFSRSTPVFQVKFNMRSVNDENHVTV